MRLFNSVAKLGMIFIILRAARSYLDPGSGSLIIQLLIAIVVGILATFRLWKSRLLSLFGIREETDEEDDESKLEED